MGIGITNSSGGWSSIVYNGVDRPTDRFLTTTEDDEFIKFKDENDKEVNLNSFILEADDTELYFIITSYTSDTQTFTNKRVFYLPPYEKIMINEVEISGIKLLVPTGTKYFIQGLFY